MNKELPVLVGEYRGHKIDVVQRVDKTSNKIRVVAQGEIHLEVGESSKGINVRFVEGRDGLGINKMKAVVESLKKGEMVAVSILKYSMENFNLGIIGDEVAPLKSPAAEVAPLKSPAAEVAPLKSPAAKV